MKITLDHNEVHDIVMQYLVSKGCKVNTLDVDFDTDSELVYAEAEVESVTLQKLVDARGTIAGDSEEVIP